MRLADADDGLAREEGSSVFHELVRQAAAAAGTRYALLGRIDTDAGVVESLAVWADGRFDEMRYDLAGTPCANVLSDGLCVYARGVARLFPDDRGLVELGVDGYAGMPIGDRTGHPRALLALFDTEPLDRRRVLPALRLFGARGKAELERLDAERRESIAQETAARGGAVLGAVAKVAELLLVADEWVAVAEDALALLGRAADVSRAYVFEATETPDGFVTSMTHEWVAEGVAPSIANPFWQGVRERDDEVRRFRRGDVLRFRTRDVESPAREVMEAEGIVTSVAVPIHVEDRLWGYLGFDETKWERAWESEAEALRAAAGTIGAAIARARVRDVLLVRERILGAVTVAAERLLASGSWRDAIEDVLGTIGRAADVGRADLFESRVDGESVVSTLVAEWAAEGVAESAVELWTDVVEPPAHAALLLGGRSVLCRADEADASLREHMAAEGTVAFLSVPFFVDGELAGYVGFDDTTGRHAFSAGEEDVLRAAASIVGAAVDRERGLERERASERILAAVASSAALLLDARSWRDVIEEVMALLGTAAGASRAYLNEAWLDGGTLISDLAYQWAAPGVTPYHKELWTEFETRPGLAEPLLRGELVQIRIDDLDGVVRRNAEVEGLKSDISVPIFAGGRIAAYLGLDEVVDAGRRWSAAEGEALRAAASVLGSAIERERGTAALRGRERILTAVASATRHLLGPSSVWDAIDPMLAGLGSGTGSSRALLARLEVRGDGRPESHVVREWAADGVARLGSDEQQLRLVVTPERLAVYEQGVGLQSSARDLDPEAREVARRVGIASWVSVPVLVRGASWGLLGLNEHVEERIWDEAEVDALSVAARALGAAIERSMADEEARVAEARLWQAQKMEAVGRLAGGVAHDLNNYLTAIVGYAEFVRRDLPEGARDDADALLGVADRVRQLVRRLLALSRPLESGEADPIDVADAVRGVEDIVCALAGGDVGVELDVAAATAPVVIAADEVERIVVNLALNARDAMPAGGTLTISVEGGDDDVRLVVSDTGTGMDEETRVRSVDPFFTTKGEQGSGLGLSTVYGIVRRRGGRVEIDSAAGAGTRVTVTLPVAG